MSCPTCSHAMIGLGCKVTDGLLFWCPRCGTIKPCDGLSVTPMLPRRCQEFAQALVSRYSVADAMETLRREWHRLGIDESVTLRSG